uniref:Uncharacterized protein n=1 Tax=Lepeophtheirus salmonis TaxID=72036 RepID=A0A0K2TQQ6_LEPSM
MTSRRRWKEFGVADIVVVIIVVARKRSWSNGGGGLLLSPRIRIRCFLYTHCLQIALIVSTKSLSWNVILGSSTLDRGSVVEYFSNRQLEGMGTTAFHEFWSHDR